MKRRYVIVLTAALAVALAASAVAMIYLQAQPRQAAPGSVSQGGVSGPGAGDETAGPSSGTAQKAEDVVVSAPDGAEYVFTAEQQAALTAQVMTAVKKYYNGEYPLVPAGATDYTPFSQAWPAGLVFPQYLGPEDFRFTTHGFEMTGVGAVIERDDGFQMLVFLYNSKDLPKDAPNYWGVADLKFIRPNEGDLARGFAAVGLTEEGANADPETGSGTLATGEWTDEQTQAVQTLVKNVVDGYREGWLPLPPTEDSEYFINEALPEGATMPQQVDFADVSLHKRPGDIWQLQADVPLDGGWVLHVWVSQTALQAEEGKTAHVVFVNEAKFEQV